MGSLAGRRSTRVARSLLVVAAAVGAGLGPWRGSWHAAAAAVLLLVWLCLWQAGRRLAPEAPVDDTGFHPGVRLACALAGLTTLGLALSIGDQALVWLGPFPTWYVHYRPRLVEHVVVIATLAVMASVTLPERLLAREARDPAGAVLGWSAVVAAQQFSAMSGLRWQSDAHFRSADAAWVLVVSVAFVVGWVAAAHRLVAAQTAGPARRLDLDEPGAPEEVVTTAFAVAALALAGLLPYGACGLVLLVVLAHLSALRLGAALRGLVGELPALLLTALGAGTGVALLTPRITLRWARRTFAGFDQVLVSPRLALGATISLVVLLLLLALRARRATARP